MAASRRRPVRRKCLKGHDLPRLSPITAAILLLAACGVQEDSPEAPAAEAGGGPSKSAPASKARWDLQASGEGAALALLTAEGRAAIRLFCPAGENRLLVNVAEFRPVASEERLSFGSGGEVTALVADPRGDAQRGGVSAAGPVPDNLEALLAGPVGVNHGAQNSGPHPAPPPQLASAFVAACREGSAARGPAGRPATVSACLMQDGKRLEVAPLRAIGTEPFWGAQIEGRCVTYSHPEDQDGTRIWTRYTPGPGGGGTWSGALGGRRFELRTRAEPGCSDGMSDRSYPIAVDLLVGGEQRRGCAERV
jgi:uncharacterized membrane protein